MARNIRLNSQEVFDDKKLIEALNKSAIKYYEYLNNELMFVYCEKKKDVSKYKCYETYFGKDNMMHLAGFKAGKLNSLCFFDKCYDGSIQPSELSFKESRKATSAKLEVLPKLLDYKYVKIYKMGNKDLITEKNNFEVGLGNHLGIIGFDRRKGPKSLARPITVMKKSIGEYVSKPMNVVLILMKSTGERYYNTVIGSVATGIFVEDMEPYIVNKIDRKLFPLIKKNR